MIKKVFSFILMLICFDGFSQSQIEKEFVVVIFDIKRNDKLHPRDIYYWVAESNHVNEYLNFEFAPLFMSFFYPSNSYDDCCLGEATHFYSINKESKFEFADDLEKRQEHLKKFLKQNSKKIQLIKKNWGQNNLLNERVSIYATPITAEFCSCKILDEKHFDNVYLPFGEIRLNPGFWNSEFASYLKNRDFSNMYPNY